MRNSRLYAAKLNSMPKLEFAISESPTKPAVSRCQLAHLSPPVPPLSYSLPRPSVLYVAYLWYRSQIQSRDSRADVSHARGIPQSSIPKCEVDSRAGVDCRILRERSFPSLLLSSSLLSFSLFFSFLAACELAGNRSRRRFAGYRPAGGWRGCINIMQISGAGPCYTTRADARDRYVLPFLYRAAPQHSQSVAAYFHRDMRDSRVSLIAPR